MFSWENIEHWSTIGLPREGLRTKLDFFKSLNIKTYSLKNDIGRPTFHQHSHSNVSCLEGAETPNIRLCKHYFSSYGVNRSFRTRGITKSAK